MAAKYSVFPICHRVMYCREVAPAISAVVAAGLRRSTTFVVAVSTFPEMLIELPTISMPGTFAPPITG